MRTIVIESREKQFVYVVAEDGNTLERGSAHGICSLADTIRAHRVPTGNALCICTVYLHRDRAVRSRFGAQAIRLSENWATGAMFGQRPEMFVNTREKGSEVSYCEWVALEHFRFIRRTNGAGLL